jgi:hypothetical protein
MKMREIKYLSLAFAVPQWLKPCSFFGIFGTTKVMP